MTFSAERYTKPCVKYAITVIGNAQDITIACSGLYLGNIGLASQLPK